MRKILLGLVTAAMAASGAISPAHAFQVQCQQGMYLIRYYSEYPQAPIEGTEVVFCDGSTQLIGRYKPYEEVQFCELCP